MFFERGLLYFDYVVFDVAGVFDCFKSYLWRASSFLFANEDIRNYLIK